MHPTPTGEHANVLVCTRPHELQTTSKECQHCAFAIADAVTAMCVPIVSLRQPVSAPSMQQWGTALPCAWCFNSIGSLQHTSRGIIKFKRVRLDKCWLQAQHDRKQSFNGLCKAGALSHVQRTTYHAEVWVDVKPLKPPTLPAEKETIRCPHWR